MASEPESGAVESGRLASGKSGGDADDAKRIEALRRGRELLLAEIGKVIVGQQKVVDHLLMALFCQGHSLMVGVPGLAKTLMVRTLARILDLSFKRIQFTPDLMPSDIIGTDVIEEDPVARVRSFRFIKGPVFANVILADEINRTPPKTQAALLEAMEEHSVTAGGQTFRLDEPFFVLATQNPIEQEGTYPLPEAQLDRFMFEIDIGYPSREEEIRIVRETTALRDVDLKRVLNARDVIEIQRAVRRMPAGESVVRYAVNLASATRPGSGEAPEFVRKFVRWGAGPRASQYLVLGAKARAAMRGNFAPAMTDVRAVAPEVLRHRIVRNFHAESEGVTADEIISRLLESVPEPA
ncbi:MAG: AAA family ATPase [Planctomycetota bacterium]|nr:AAA family ATPase [Planctomycetota bacterium]